jgi:hypothetical protein
MKIIPNWESSGNYKRNCKGNDDMTGESIEVFLVCLLYPYWEMIPRAKVLPPFSAFALLFICLGVDGSSFCPVGPSLYVFNSLEMPLVPARLEHLEGPTCSRYSGTSFSGATMWVAQKCLGDLYQCPSKSFFRKCFRI